MWEYQSAYADFPAFGWDERGNWHGGNIRVRIFSRNRFDRLRRPTPIVAVKAESALHIEFSIGPGAENQTQFRAGQELGGRAGIGRVDQAGDIKVVQVATQGRDRTEFLRPLNFIFHIKANLRVRKAIGLRSRGQSVAGRGVSFVYAHAIFGLVQGVIDPIVADLQPNLFSTWRPNHWLKIVWLASSPATQRLSCCSNWSPRTGSVRK